jgi:hypothetical protein
MQLLLLKQTIRRILTAHHYWLIRDAAFDLNVALHWEIVRAFPLITQVSKRHKSNLNFFNKGICYI